MLRDNVIEPIQAALKAGWVIKVDDKGASDYKAKRWLLLMILGSTTLKSASESERVQHKDLNLRTLLRVGFSYGCPKSSSGVYALYSLC